MNKNKIIFAILGAVLVLIIIFMAFTLRSSTETTNTSTSNSWFSIWIVWDSQDSFNDFLSEFKEANPVYANKNNITIESFSDYESYFYALVSAFSKDQWPDIFMMSGAEQSVLEDQIVGIDPAIISPSEFRKLYRWVFWDDLIERTGDGVEFLRWLPVWYESLWVYYNRRYFTSEDFESWTALGSAVSDITEKNNGSIIPLGLWKWSGTVHAGDIMTQLMVLWGGESLDTLQSQSITQAFQVYGDYADADGDNAYNRLLSNNIEKNNLDLFSLGEVAAVIGYPRTLMDIDDKWYRSSFLLATSFPSYVWSEHRTLANYNYFVINKDSADTTFALDLLSFMTTDDGAEDYLDAFPYYLPAKISLEDDMFEEKVDEWYNVVYQDFYDRNSILTSFNAGIKSLYDAQILTLLDSEEISVSWFDNLRKILLCTTGKVLTLENLSQNCR